MKKVVISVVLAVLITYVILLVPAALIYSAIRYCCENNVDIDNIVPQEWGEYIPLFD